METNSLMREQKEMYDNSINQKGNTSKVAMIVVNYNDFENTARLIEEVREYNLITWVVVVDNASSDETRDQLKKLTDEKIIILFSKKNMGYARGNNIGMRYAIEKLDVDTFVIANPDISYSEQTLYKLLEVCNQKEQKIGLVTAQMMSCKSNYGYGVWKFPSIEKQIFNNFILLKKIFGDRTRYLPKELQEDLCKVDVIAGSFFVCSTATMQEIGFFDENTFLFGEENILAYKLKNAGYTNYLCTNLSFEHEHSASIDKNVKNIRKKFMWLYDSMVYFNKQYLHTNRFQDMLYNISFFVGLNSYLLVRRIFTKKNIREKR